MTRSFSVGAVALAAYLGLFSGCDTSTAERSSIPPEQNATNGASALPREVGPTTGVTEPDSPPAPSVEKSVDAGAAMPDQSSAVDRVSLDADLVRQFADLASDAAVERAAAAESLEQAGQAAYHQALAVLSSDPSADDVARRGAMRFLVGRVPPSDRRAIECVSSSLTDSDVALRHTALQVVERLPDEQAIVSLPGLLAMAGDTGDSDTYREKAIHAIADLGRLAETAAGELESLATSTAGLRVRRAAFYALSKAAEPARAEAFFVAQIKANSEPELRRLAARWLAEVATNDACLTALVLAMNDSEKEVRRAASDALLSIGRPAVAPLVEALGSPERQLRRYAIFTLGKLGPLAEPAVGPLEKLTDDADPELSELARVSIRLIRRQ